MQRRSKLSESSMREGEALKAFGVKRRKILVITVAGAIGVVIMAGVIIGIVASRGDSKTEEAAPEIEESQPEENNTEAVEPSMQTKSQETTDDQETAPAESEMTEEPVQEDFMNEPEEPAQEEWQDEVSEEEWTEEVPMDFEE